MVTNKNTREYEVQLWTLQDSFITVLKSFNVDTFGTIEEPKMELSDDAEDRFTFKLPMYIKNGNEFKENPNWYNVRNGNLIVNLRKIKVIFYRGTERQRVFEFVITKVTETHEGFEKTCEVECEGLAFNELGKTGYNIDLSQELYEIDAENGFEAEEGITLETVTQGYEYILQNKTVEIKNITILNNNNEYYPTSIDYDEYNYKVTITLPDGLSGPCNIKYTYVPINNINYWLAKVFPENSVWEYQINMNWGEFIEENRESNVIYEDGYIENWIVDEAGNFIPTSIMNYKEKCRIVTESESNRYNLTQSIAETFGVFCRYIYEYDDNLYIINRKVEFYNNALQEQEEILDFTYYYNTENISREMDSADQISKMYILSSSNEDLITSSITEVNANKTLENYLLNFDYLYEIGAIDEDQIEQIEEFEKEIRKINLQLRALSDKITIYENTINKFKAIRDTASVSTAEALETMEDEYAYIQALYNANTEDYDGDPETFERTGNNPDIVVIITKNDVRTCNIRENGVRPNTIKAYASIDDAKKKQNEFTNFQIVIDSETGFATGLKNVGTLQNNSSTLFLTYSYSLDLYHKILGDIWKLKYNEEEEKYDRYNEIVKFIDGERDENDNLIDPDDGLLNITRKEYNQVLKKKETLLLNFERNLGPALREGTWTPDDQYAKYGDRRQQSLNLLNNTSFEDGVVSIGFDPIIFEGEQQNYFTTFGSTNQESSEQKNYYPCIDLLSEVGGGETIWDKIVEKLNDPNNDYTIYDVGFIWNDTLPNISALGTEYAITYPQIYRIGSEAQVTFLGNIEEEDDKRLKCVLMLTDAAGYCNSAAIITKNNAQGEQLNGTQTDIISQLKGCIGILKVENNVYNIDKIIDIESSYWIEENDLESYKTVYPRIKIPFTTFVDNSTEYSLYLENSELRPFEDYTTAWRYDIGNNEQLDDLDFWEEIETAYKEWIRSGTAEKPSELQELENISYNCYVTIKPEVLLRNNARFGNYQFFYKLSNTGLAIYLDGIKVMKENSVPKVTYDITPVVLNSNFMEEDYNKIHTIIHINDYELKFNEVIGYISGVSLDLDQPWEDTVEVKNYTNKFEDLFSSIVASTAAVQKNSGAISVSSQAFISTGVVSEDTLQKSLDDASISLNFSNSNFVINDSGIKAYSDEGLVYYSPKGIFTASEKDDNNEWKWNTSILPTGISANAITTGQLDTNLIRIFSGDDLRFQINGNGLFAYKSWFNNVIEEGKTYTFIDQNQEPGTQSKTINDAKAEQSTGQAGYNGLDPAQYLQINDDGLFLIAAKGAYLVGDNTIVHLNEDIKRVEVSWNGLILRNNNNIETFKADPTTGDLTITGNFKINGGDTTAELTYEKLRFGPFQLRKEAKIENNETVTESLTFIYVQE